MEAGKKSLGSGVNMEPENNTANTTETAASSSVYVTAEQLTIQDQDNTETVDDISDIAFGGTMATDECWLLTTAPSQEESKRSDKHAPSLNIEYVVVDDAHGLANCVVEIRKTTVKDPLIAFHCECSILVNTLGELQHLSIATRNKGFIVDIKTLKSQPFDSGLCDIIENIHIKKLMFDCREDSDALFHQFNVKLEGVLDIQLLEIIKQSSAFSEESDGRRRCERHEDVVRVKSLLECIELYTKSKRLIQAERSNAGKLSDWGQRPLQKKELNYAMTHAMSLFQLYDKLMPVGDEITRFEVASAIYVNLKRSIGIRTFDEFENNGYLPIDVIPPKGKTSFPPGSINCTKCSRFFPREEFSNTQIGNGTQLCRICKQVKQEQEESARLIYERKQSMKRLRRKYRRRALAIWCGVFWLNMCIIFTFMYINAK